MKILGLILFFLTFQSTVYSQILFQKIVTGDIVNDNAYGSGCVWGDYNDDGKLDMFVTAYNDFGTSGYPLLYQNLGNGSFLKITDNVITTSSLPQTLACAWGDYNRDCRIDLFVSTGYNQPNLLYKNLGAGNFQRILTGNIVNTNGHSGGVCWTDYNKDGYLDILVVQHGYNLLYRGNANGNFTQITSGPIVTDYGTHRRAAWGDYNNDRYPDLFVCNFDGQTNNLYLNNGNGTFTKIISGPIVTTSNWGSGCSWGDYNNDGWLDLVVTTGGGGPTLLYRNNHNSTFTAITGGAIGNDTSTGFGCNWGDIDNDGDLDLFIANNYNKRNALYRNDGDNNFTKLYSEIVCQEISSSVGSAFGDYDRNGKLDLFVVNQGYGGPSQSDFLYKNIGAAPYYIVIKLKGGGIGTRIRLRVGNHLQIREVSGGNSCGSQDMLWQHFGLGFLAGDTNPVIDSIVVEWFDGYIESATNIGINQEIEFGGIIGIEPTSNEMPDEYSLSQNYPNPFNPFTNISYSIIKESLVRISVHDIEGRLVQTLVNSKQAPGTYTVAFGGSHLSSGTYFYRLETEEFTATRKMVVLK